MVQRRCLKLLELHCRLLLLWLLLRRVDNLDLRLFVAILVLSLLLKSVLRLLLERGASLFQVLECFVGFLRQSAYVLL